MANCQGKRLMEKMHSEGKIRHLTMVEFRELPGFPLPPYLFFAYYFSNPACRYYVKFLKLLI